MAEKEQGIDTNLLGVNRVRNAADALLPQDYVTLRQRDLLQSRDINFPAHGITTPEIPAFGLLPVYISSTGTIEPAIANAETTLFDFFVSAVPNVNTLTIFEGRFFTIAHGLTTGRWYCLSQTTAGQVVDRATLDARTTFIQFAFFTLDANTLLIRPQAGFKDFG